MKITKRNNLKFRRRYYVKTIEDSETYSKIKICGKFSFVYVKNLNTEWECLNAYKNDILVRKFLRDHGTYNYYRYHSNGLIKSMYIPKYNGEDRDVVTVYFKHDNKGNLLYSYILVEEEEYILEDCRLYQLNGFKLKMQEKIKSKDENIIQVKF